MLFSPRPTAPRRSALLALAALCVAGTCALPARAASPETPGAGDAAVRSGLQTVPKTRLSRKGAGPATPDPLLSSGAEPGTVNTFGWEAERAEVSGRRSALVAKRRAALGSLGKPIVVREKEAAGVRGSNDSARRAQLIGALGTGRHDRPTAQISGTLAPPVLNPTRFAQRSGEDGSIGQASPVGLTSGASRRTSGVVGDGAHGSTGDDTGDFDFYALPGLKAGARLVVDIDLPSTSTLDSMVYLYDAKGAIVADNDDDPAGGTASFLTATIPAAGSYYLLVTGFPALPVSAFDARSGNGSGSEGAYDVTFGLDVTDVDYYAVDLRAGDVLSGSVSGQAGRLGVLDRRRTLVMGSARDASGLFPDSSPLLGGGNAVVDHVAQRAGRYYVGVETGTGAYTLSLEVLRPGTTAAGKKQTIFLDLDGATLDTAIFPTGGESGVRRLSPLSAFLGRLQIPASKQDALIDTIVATVKENLRHDFAGTGVTIKVLNSRDHRDVFGRTDVSRVIIGGTTTEAGIDTVGIAESVDPGNFDTSETALILLDTLSAPASTDDGTRSINDFLRPTSSLASRIRFAGTVIGTGASHEVGHLLGSWHTDGLDDRPNLMDAGAGTAGLFGVGKDGIGGTRDDVDLDFGADSFATGEGFTGTENTRTRTRWALR